MKQVKILIAAMMLFGFSLKAQTKKEIKSVVVTFYTNSNDKDDDTYVSISLNTHDYRFNSDSYLAKKEGIGGHWNDHSTNEISLDMAGRYDLNAIDNAFIRLSISTNGNDKWEFDHKVEIIYLENGESRTLTKQFSGKVLTQDNPSTTNTLF